MDKILIINFYSEANISKILKISNISYLQHLLKKAKNNIKVYINVFLHQTIKKLKVNGIDVELMVKKLCINLDAFEVQNNNRNNNKKV